jgi:hypothetical protein
MKRLLLCDGSIDVLGLFADAAGLGEIGVGLLVRSIMPDCIRMDN